MSKQLWCERVATIIADYRAEDGLALDAAHVDQWVRQFVAGVQEPLLAELAHVLAKTYASRDGIKGFLAGLTNNEKLAGDDPASFWKGSRFLQIQQAGNSQNDMLALFDVALHNAFSIRIDQCGTKPDRYVYLDDGVFSGGRIKSDLIRWIKEDAPSKIELSVIVVAVHTLGEYFAAQDIKKAALEAGKSISIDWWRAITLEDRKTYMANSDVLRPSHIALEVVPYVAALGVEPVLRGGNAVGALGLFSSPTGRELVEQEFLKGGVRVRAMCPFFDQYMRPLGRALMKTTGFGTMFVTYRNIANNAPLVLWAGDPWYPLFPRRTN